MQIERTKDRVILTAQEVQMILKEHLEKATGRTIDGKVNFQNSDRGTQGIETSVYAHLTYKD
jgi:hypothetical protein